VRPPVCTYNTFFYLCMHVFCLAGGLVCERWEGVMKIVVCVYTPKTILQGTVKGGRGQGGQRKRWEDNVREWTGLEFGKSQRAVENREKWRKLVAKSSVVPQRG
ncbi:hypothetical protein, partial [Thiolapillus sp.]|uniref:hypothetical protein n=1 Tax=Thiolapillus sp. TaxID=2017437 RepID=UPI003AF69542